jgi:hypothetical protein
MITKTASEARLGWGELIRAVKTSGGGEHAQITRTRGRPTDRVEAAETVAVLVPGEWYNDLPEACMPSEAKVRTIKSSQARDKLREAIELALGGVHTKITQYGSLDAVLVPLDWYEEVSA